MRVVHGFLHIAGVLRHLWISISYASLYKPQLSCPCTSPKSSSPGLSRPRSFHVRIAPSPNPLLQLHSASWSSLRQAASPAVCREGSRRLWFTTRPCWKNAPERTRPRPSALSADPRVSCLNRCPSLATRSCHPCLGEGGDSNAPCRTAGAPHATAWIPRAPRAPQLRQSPSHSTQPLFHYLLSRPGADPRRRNHRVQARTLPAQLQCGP